MDYLIQKDRGHWLMANSSESHSFKRLKDALEYCKQKRLNVVVIGERDDKVYRFGAARRGTDQ